MELCSTCDRKIIRNQRILKIEETDLWAAAYYGDELARIILLAKEKNSTPARNFLVELLVRQLMEAISGLESSVALTLIPLPSRQAANRERGYRHSFLLAKGLAAAFTKLGGGAVEVRESLFVNRTIADQSNLNRQERALNIHGAYSVRSGRKFNFTGAHSDRLYLIDDLVTSGASVREGLRALRAAGASPAGALSAGVALGVSTGVFS